MRRQSGISWVSGLTVGCVDNGLGASYLHCVSRGQEYRRGEWSNLFKELEEEKRWKGKMGTKSQLQSSNRVPPCLKSDTPAANMQEFLQQTLRDFASFVPHLGNKGQFASLENLRESKRHIEHVGDVLDLLAASQRQT